MSTQAIAGAAASAAILGGGGTLAAYAAGAFNQKNEPEKYEDFQAYLNAKLNESHTYIGGENGLKDKIKTNLEATNAKKDSYKEELRKIVIRTNETDVQTTDLDNATTNDGSLSKVFEKAKTWCEATKIKKYAEKDEKWTKATIESDPDWKPFETVCLEKKNITVAPVAQNQNTVNTSQGTGT
ncbi:hypothetical protein MHSWG343_06310 [Candidatus Mycoplasma haematohominis]|uniref:Uncharacterized protein n=1 Tax=Candidatus Mycoplasma haematohominis TaxID=1494318 RepID=A0A478FRG8_9MOLU|nr:hypothetical protein MHSWG343_06310 [Candidatus Mycoplasma haemohominis]